MSGGTLVIGIGNGLRGDDALGRLAVRNLALPEGAVIIEHDGEPASLMERWQGFDRVILVDAVSSGSAPGSLFRFDLLSRLPEFRARTSTHAFGIGDAVELARALGKLPRQIVFYGVEAGHFSVGGDLSPQIQSALEILRKRIMEDLHA